MSERWTDKKSGYVGTRTSPLVGVARGLSLNAYNREELGGLNQTQLQRTTPDGAVRAQRFGMYEKVVYEAITPQIPGFPFRFWTIPLYTFDAFVPLQRDNYSGFVWGVDSPMGAPPTPNYQMSYYGRIVHLSQTYYRIISEQRFLTLAPTLFNVLYTNAQNFFGFGWGFQSPFVPWPPIRATQGQIGTLYNWKIETPYLYIYYDKQFYYFSTSDTFHYVEGGYQHWFCGTDITSRFPFTSFKAVITTKQQLLFINISTKLVYNQFLQEQPQFTVNIFGEVLNANGVMVAKLPWKAGGGYLDPFFNYSVATGLTFSWERTDSIPGGSPEYWVITTDTNFYEDWDYVKDVVYGKKYALDYSGITEALFIL